MKHRKPLQPLAMFSDLSERIYYNQPGLPLYTRNDMLSRFDFNMACHWHRDLEFVHAVTGSMEYFVNGTIVHIPTGDGLFACWPAPFRMWPRWRTRAASTPPVISSACSTSEQGSLRSSGGAH